ncbi:uncharacterized protein LOC128133624 [Lactuca sativa]|uniref:uncharacterized protein LOC128133624 n=1 Tax=Lactuca sativa TaxID=4236 RepID=UPI0022AF899C|nr:uncharacterized protein LOC128133624 [Lactuca sativa]
MAVVVIGDIDRKRKRHGVGKERALESIIKYCKNASENDEELREYSLQALESFLLRCPRDIFSYCNEILHLTLEYLVMIPISRITWKKTLMMKFMMMMRMMIVPMSIQMMRMSVGKSSISSSSGSSSSTSLGSSSGSSSNTFSGFSSSSSSI